MLGAVAQPGGIDLLPLGIHADIGVRIECAIGDEYEAVDFVNVPLTPLHDVGNFLDGRRAVRQLRIAISPCSVGTLSA